MSKSYYNVKKCRYLKKRRKLASSSDDTALGDDRYSQNDSDSCNSDDENENNHSENDNNDSDNENNDNDDVNNDSRSDNNASGHSSNGDNSNGSNSDSNEDELDEINGPITLKSKIRSWALENIGTLNNKVISEMLCIWRSEGYVNLPKTAEALLQTPSKIVVREMPAKKEQMGYYCYFGIQYCLQNRVNPAVYVKDTINILVNIDGLPVYNNSSQQFWPILIQILDQEYDCKPVVVAIFSGKSKPNSVEEFLADFINEATLLIRNGLTIEDKQYTFHIAGFVCDMPARSFIKCTKGHSGFYACERCTAKGITINGKRIYCDMQSELRTNESFREKRQPNHHISNCVTPLLRIPGFDPVKSVILDHMHLLFLGIMKSLLEKWIKGDNLCRIGTQNRAQLKSMLETLSEYIPKEFQRKKFNFDDILHWKATQYRFFLLYCGPIMLKHVLQKDKYRHFLILAVACRMLCGRNAVQHSDDSERLLRQFFFLMPTLYGADSQVMNYHNLIHLADDVRNMNVSLPLISAFPFESCLGKLKQLIRTPKNPLIQVAKRLSEMENAGVNLVRRHPLISNCKPVMRFEVKQQFSLDETELVYYRQMKITGFIVTTSPPDNVIKLKNGVIVEVSKIYSHQKEVLNINDIHLKGKIYKSDEHIFDFPCSSSKIGFEALQNSRRKVAFPANDIQTKCFLFPLNVIFYSVDLLHP